MSLLEGHGNYVMNELGERHVHGAERMARVLHTRRQQRGLGGQIQKLLGIEMKMRQYEVGERFVRGVEARRGHRRARRGVARRVVAPDGRRSSTIRRPGSRACRPTPAAHGAIAG